MTGTSPEVRSYVVVTPAANSSVAASLPVLSLFQSDGTPFSAAGFEVMPNQAVFSGADITAVKVELNALRTKLINAGLMAAS